MSSGPVPGGMSRWLAAEALAAGLSYGAGLWWASVCLVASFRPNDLSAPYWSGVPHLRTDTSGIPAFLVVTVCLSTSEYLRLRRRQNAPAKPAQAVAGGRATPLALAISETVGLLATGLVVYVSVNTVTHPATLGIRATHLAPWPTEGTLRVAALVLCVCSVTALRYLCAASTGGRDGRSGRADSSTACDIGRDSPRPGPLEIPTMPEASQLPPGEGCGRDRESGSQEPDPDTVGAEGLRGPRQVSVTAVRSAADHADGVAPGVRLAG
jgi:hypothetical protein